jgi:uncharacterized protein
LASGVRNEVKQRERSRVAGNFALRMNCPRCLVPMAEGTIDGDIPSVDCAKCTGHFIAVSDLKKVESVVDVKMLKWRHLPGIETQGRILICPRCPGTKPMDKVISQRDQRVIMDICHTCHGLWLDRGELQAIRQRGLLGAMADIISFLRKG